MVPSLPDLLHFSESIPGHTRWSLWPGTPDKNGRHQYYYVCLDVIIYWIFSFPPFPLDTFDGNFPFNGYCIELVLCFSFMGYCWKVINLMFEPFGEDDYIFSSCLFLCSQQDLRAVDYHKNYLMLRISSRNLWEGISDVGNFVDSLQSAADSLFKQVMINLSIFCIEVPSFVVYSDNLLQIIFVHKKHFKKEDYNHLESILFQQPKHYLEVCASSFWFDRESFMYMSCFYYVLLFN